MSDPDGLNVGTPCWIDSHGDPEAPSSASHQLGPSDAVSKAIAALTWLFGMFDESDIVR